MRHTQDSGNVSLQFLHCKFWFAFFTCTFYNILQLKSRSFCYSELKKSTVVVVFLFVFRLVFILCFYPFIRPVHKHETNPHNQSDKRRQSSCM